MKTIIDLPVRVTLSGRVYRIRPTVKRVLAALDALEDDGLLYADRARLFVWLVYRFPRPRATEEAVNAALDLLREEPPYRRMDGPETLSLDQDAALIVAAFRQLYGIDLPGEAGRLDWRVFQALLSGITDGTRIGEIMGIRARKLPRWTAYNGEQIRELQKLKAVYALKKRHGETFEDGLRHMAMVLASLAEDKTDDKPGDRPRPDHAGMADEADGAH